MWTHVHSFYAPKIAMYAARIEVKLLLSSSLSHWYRSTDRLLPPHDKFTIVCDDDMINALIDFIDAVCECDARSFARYDCAMRYL